jgi:iron complex outermembrane receptor protein
MMPSIILPKMGKLESILGIQGMYQTNVNSGEEYLIPDATTNDFGVLGLLIMNGITTARFRQVCVLTIEKINDRGTWNFREEGYFKAVDKSFDSFNALGYKTN